MGFCTKDQHRDFLRLVPLVEKMMIDGGITLIKYSLEVGKESRNVDLLLGSMIP